MANDVEIDRALHAVATTLNDQHVDDFRPERVQEIVTEALGGEPLLTVDPGGGLHDGSGARIGTVRRTPSGEWIAERQNEAADRSSVAVPSAPRESKLKGLLAKLKK